MTSRVLERLKGPRTKVPVRQYRTLLVKYQGRQKGIVALASVLILTIIGLQLVNPQIMRYFIDEAVAGSPLSRLVAAAGVFIAVARYAERTTSSFSGKARLMPRARSTTFCDPPQRCSESGLVISIVLNQPPSSTPIKIGVPKEQICHNGT